jgi:trehalose synthase-fused probable maltokinase
MTASPDSPEIGNAAILPVLRAAMRSAAPRWLEERRWFGDKGRGVVGIELEDALVERVGGDWLTLAVLRVAFAAGDPSRYLLPLAIVADPSGYEIIATDVDGMAGALVDATQAPWFGSWLIARFARSRPSPDDRWTFSPMPDARSSLSAACGVSPAVSGAEQSNTSIRFDEIAMAKLVRRLQPGPNPDEEVLRALAGVEFRHVPHLLASASWRAADGVGHPIALIQEYVFNEGDGWTWMLHRLAAIASGETADDAVDAERLLGRRTGELHVALSRVVAPDFATVICDEPAVDANTRRTRAAVATATGLLRKHASVLPQAVRARLPALIDGVTQAADRIDGYQAERGLRRIRVHGDYHLGQTLRMPGGDWTVIDFEGEPARPVAERREKTSALKDVAGMLRSFAYARGAAELATGVSTTAATRLSGWETGARAAFLAGYREAVSAAPVPLVPADDDAFAAAVAAWELDKALYEIAYEVRNRPDWLELPLRGVLTNAPS